MFLQQFCGINAIAFYYQTFFVQAGSDLDPGLSATIVALAQGAGTIVVSIVTVTVWAKCMFVLSH